MANIDNPLVLPNYSDAQFLRLVHEFQKCTQLWEQVACIYKYFPEEKIGLLNPISRRINGEIAEFGISIKDRSVAEKVANLFVDFSKREHFEIRYNEIWNRLVNNHDGIECDGIIEAELVLIKARYDDFCKEHPWDPNCPDKSDSIEETLTKSFQRGFREEKRGVTIFSYPYSSINEIVELPNRYLNEDILEMMAFGASERMLELRLLKLQGKLKEDKSYFIKIWAELPENQHLKFREGRGGSNSSFHNSSPNHTIFVNPDGNINIESVEKKAPQTLEDIWLVKTPKHYERVLEYLKEGSYYVKEINGHLEWQKINHHITYLAAFTRTCIDAGFIKDLGSAPDYKRILQNTFDITFNGKPFQSLSTRTFDAAYLDAFEKIKDIK